MKQLKKENTQQPPADKVPQREKKKNPFLAAFLGLLPGLGLLYVGLPAHGLIVFLTCWMIVPYIYGIVNAFTSAVKFNKGIPYGKKVGLFFSVVSGFLITMLIYFSAIKTGILPGLLKSRQAPLAVSTAAVVSATAAAPVAEQVSKSTAPANSTGGDNTFREEIYDASSLEKIFNGEGDVPMYPGASAMGTIMKEGYLGFKFSTAAAINSVVSFYQSQLKKAGYDLKSSDYKDGAVKAVLSFTREKNECKISLEKTESGSTSGLISLNK